MNSEQLLHRRDRRELRDDYGADWDLRMLATAFLKLSRARSVRTCTSSSSGIRSAGVVTIKCSSGARLTEVYRPPQTR